MMKLAMCVPEAHTPRIEDGHGDIRAPVLAHPRLRHMMPFYPAVQPHTRTAISSAMAPADLVILREMKSSNHCRGHSRPSSPTTHDARLPRSTAIYTHRNLHRSPKPPLSFYLPSPFNPLFLAYIFFLFSPLIFTPPPFLTHTLLPPAHVIVQSLSHVSVTPIAKICTCFSPFSCIHHCCSLSHSPRPPTRQQCRNEGEGEGALASAASLPSSKQNNCSPLF